MRTKYALVAFAPVALVLQLGSASALPDRDVRARWEEAVEPQASKVIIHNLSDRPAEASLGSAAVAISANGVAEVAAEPGQLRSEAALLVLQAPNGFDAASLEIDKSVSDGSRQARGRLVAAGPAWARGLTAGKRSVRHGATGAAGIKSDDPAARVEVAVAFLAPHTLVRIRQLDAMGNEVTSLLASASRPVRWRAALEPVGGESRIEMETLRGEAQGTATVKSVSANGKPSPIEPPFTAMAGGLGLFDPDINWEKSPPLYYNVTGAPASVCGDLYTSRNGGSYVVSPGWICTNASGSATKGPWYYSNQSDDETAYAYVIWSNGQSTNTDVHIWDVRGPSASVTSPGASPAPTSFYGTGTDPIWGAGFSSSWGTRCVTYFYDRTTASYWYPGSGYSSYFPYNSPYCTISYPYGDPSHTVTWSEGQIPPGYAHISGHCYEWGVYLYEASYSRSEKYDWEPYYFCVP